MHAGIENSMRMQIINMAIGHGFIMIDIISKWTINSSELINSSHTYWIKFYHKKDTAHEN